MYIQTLHLQLLISEIYMYCGRMSAEMINIKNDGCVWLSDSVMRYQLIDCELLTSVSCRRHKKLTGHR